MQISRRIRWKELEIREISVCINIQRFAGMHLEYACFRRFRLRLRLRQTEKSAEKHSETIMEKRTHRQSLTGEMRIELVNCVQKFSHSLGL